MQSNIVLAALVGLVVGIQGSLDLMSGQEPLFPLYPDDADEDLLFRSEKARNAALRDLEHMPHSSLWGHKFMGGGAGEGKQYLSPDGTIMNHEEVKTDAILPSYCEPPNPCPPGFTSDDGCLEEFENTAEFSQSYQARQDCMCDEEHMFNCPTNQHQQDSYLQSQFPDQPPIATLEEFFSKRLSDYHPELRAKKFHVNKKAAKKSSGNPYLDGLQQHEHIVAKKG